MADALDVTRTTLGVERFGIEVQIPLVARFVAGLVDPLPAERFVGHPMIARTDLSEFLEHFLGIVEVEQFVTVVEWSFSDFGDDLEVVFGVNLENRDFTLPAVRNRTKRKPRTAKKNSALQEQRNGILKNIWD